MKNIIKEPSTWLLILLVGFPQISETIYTPSLPLLARYLLTTDNKVQQTLSVYFVGFAVGVLVWGILADKIGRRPCIMYGLFIYILGSLGCLLSQSVNILILFRFVQAYGASTGSVVTQTIIRDSYNDQRRPVMFAKISAALAFSPAIGPVLGGILSQFIGLSAVFYFLITMGLCIFLVAFGKLLETRPIIVSCSPKSPWQMACCMIKDPSIWLFGGLIGLINGIIFSYYSEAPFIFLNCLHFNSIEYGFIGVFVSIASFGGALISKRLSVRLSYKSIITIGVSVLALGGLVFLIISLVAYAPSLLAIGIVISLIIIMFGLGIALPHCLSQALINYKNSLGISGALLGLYYYLLVGFITWLVSALHTGSLLLFPIFVLVFSVIMLIATKALSFKAVGS